MEQTVEQTVYQKDPNDILVEDRQRKRIKKGKIEELARSIDDIGQLHPGICYINKEEQLTLIIGECRLKACKLLKLPFSYTLKEEITDELLLHQIELEENLYREDLHWLDEVNAKKELHELYQLRYGLTQQGAAGGHKLSDTADHLGTSLGLIAGDIEVAVWASEVPEVADAKNKTMAKKIVERLKKGVKRHIALKEALDIVDTIEDEDGDEDEFDTLTDPDAPDSPEIINTRDMVLPKPKIDKTTQKILVEYDSRCWLGKMEPILENLDPGLSGFDIVIFDPPWGVDFDKVRLDSGDTETYEDSFELFQIRLLHWLELIYDEMTENSHLYMFFGIVQHQFVYDTLEQVGFTTNRMPLFWYKKGAHRTRAPEVWPGRCYEAIAYARKGSKPLFKLGAPDIIETPAPTPNMKQDHPSAKHPDIYKELLIRSASPGDKVLDPMAGSGMCAVACEALRTELALDWTLIEVKQNFRDLQLMNLLRGYGEIVKLKLTPPTDFKQLVPGSPEWQNYWKGHPEQQDEMLAWMNDLKAKEDSNVPAEILGN